MIVNLESRMIVIRSRQFDLLPVFLELVPVQCTVTCHLYLTDGYTLSMDVLMY